jgi:hypothetical protein
MPGGILHQPLGVRPSRSLVARGGLARTFGSLAGFIVVSFLFWGIYILADAFANPIDAGATAVICAAFIIAMGAILLFYLLKPGMRARATAHASVTDPVVAHPSLFPSAGTARRADVRNNLAYQRFYVDHSHIRQ